MTKSTEDLLRELEGSGVLGSASPAAPRRSQPLSDAPRTRDSGSIWFLILAAAMLAVLGSIPFGADLLYPFSLFVTTVHETSHAVAATITGGSVVSLRTSPDLSGVTYIAGGWRVLEAPAGYLGATLVGCYLLITPLRWARWAVGSLIVVPVADLVAFHPASTFTAFWCSVFIAALGVASWKLRARWVQFVQMLVGAACGLNAARDLANLFLISSTRSDIHTDATTMSGIVPLPATMWAVIWTALSLGLLALSLSVVLRRGLPRSERQTTIPAVDK